MLFCNWADYGPQKIGADAPHIEGNARVSTLYRTTMVSLTIVFFMIAAIVAIYAVSLVTLAVSVAVR